MLDVDTFPTALYFMADNFFKARPKERRRPGPEASPSPGGVVTLAVFARFPRFASERDSHRYAHANSRSASPTLPDRPQLNRLVRSRAEPIEEFALHLAKTTEVRRCPHEALDGAAMAVRDSKRRGSGWLAGQADIGWPNRLGWHEGFKLLMSVSPRGAVTGYGFGPASTADQPLAETFPESRRHPDSRLAGAGEGASGHYVADKGFGGLEDHRRWLEHYGARVVHPPKRSSLKRSWPKRLRRWVAGIRQIVEGVYDKLLNAFGLHRGRPHETSGARARLAARVALRNFCVWLNDRPGRPWLAFADLLGW
jgi:hypothetical protein